MSDSVVTGFKPEAEHGLISTSLEVEQLDTTLFRSSNSFWKPIHAAGVFGGQVISQALVSATNTVDPAYSVHSLHCYFLLRASPSIPIIYFVERPREGRSYTTRVVKASQSGKLIFIMICSFQKPEPLQYSQQIPMPPDVPQPDTLEPLEDTYERLLRDNPMLDPLARDFYTSIATDRRLSPVEIRFATDRRDREGGYVIMWWMRVRKFRGMPAKFEQSFQRCILAYLSDHHFIATASRALGLTRTKGPRRQSMGGSLDHSIFYYSNDFDCSEWLLFMAISMQMTSPVGGNGRGVVMARIYTQSGTLIAITTQEGVTRVDPRFVEQELKAEKTKL